MFVKILEVGAVPRQKRQSEQTGRTPAPAMRAPPGQVRSTQKAETHQRVLDFARDHFLAKGYEDTALRDIARSAGVSVGAVLAHYGSKADLFNAVLRGEYENTLVRMQAALGPQDGARARLGRAFGAAYELHFSTLDIVRAAMLASWVRSEEGDKSNREALRPLFTLVIEELNAGAARGEVRADAALPLVAEMMIELYLASFRRAVYGGWPLPRMTAAYAVHLDIIFQGIAQRG
jgi:AcrR family transcriptional regulator